MATPAAARPRRPSTPSFLSNEDFSYPVPTRSGALASLIRTRSASSLSSNARSRYLQDEEAGFVRHADEDDIGRLLVDEERLSQLLYGTRARSMNLLGKSNPRYRWEKYWKHDDELQGMSTPM